MERDFTFCGLGLWGVAFENLGSKNIDEIINSTLHQVFGKRGANIALLIGRYRGNPYVGIAFGSGCVGLYQYACKTKERIQKLLFLAPELELWENGVGFKALTYQLEFHLTLDSISHYSSKTHTNPSSKIEELTRLGTLYIWHS